MRFVLSGTIDIFILILLIDTTMPLVVFCEGAFFFTRRNKKKIKTKIQEPTTKYTNEL